MIGIKLVREAKNKFVVFYCSKKVDSKERVRAFCNFTSMSGPDEAKQWVQYIRAKINNIPVNRKILYHTSESLTLTNFGHRDPFQKADDSLR